MDEKLKQEIKAMVDDFFSEKEEADIRRKTEEALQKSAEAIKDLTTALEDKNTESEEAVAKIVDLDQQIATLKSELEAAMTAKSTAEAKFDEVSKLLEEKRKDEVASTRVSALIKAGVGTEALSSKVREMTDEEFASYLSERVELRNAVMAELEASKAKAEADSAIAEAEAAKTEAVKEDKEEVAAVEEKADEINTPPAQISHSQAISAAMNFESVPSQTIMAKYAELGKAMAKSMAGNKDKD